MTGIRDIAIRWYRKAFGAPPGTDIRDQGFDTVLDGNTAVALSEATIASHAVLGGSMPVADADTVWLREVERGGTNLFGETLSADTSEGPRGIVAAATGLALAGRRATAFLSGADIAAAQDLLASAAGKHAPLVLHLGTHATTGHGTASGSGHESVHLSAESGCFVLFAHNVQQAVDFTFIARRVAEEALVPGLVVMDGAQTALAVQDVRLLSPAQVEGFLGPAREEVEAPNPAQALLFGETRRRLPAWHDLDEPMLTGAVFGEPGFGPGAAARRPYFDDFVTTSLASAFDQFARQTGRAYAALLEHEINGATTVLVAQGGAVEAARFAADTLRKQHDARVGVVGIQALRPFPADALANALAGAEQVYVLERSDAPLAGQPPLTRELNAALRRIENGPACRPVVYGLGGLPLRGQDIVALCKDTVSSSAAPLYLGVTFDDETTRHPKREVLFDALRRAYPDAARLGVRAADEMPLPRQRGTLAVAIQGTGNTRQLIEATATLLYRLQGGRIRSRPAATWPGVSAARSDWLVHGDDSLVDPGDGLHPDITLDVDRRTVKLVDSSDEFLIPVADDAPLGDALLGGLFAALVRRKSIEASLRRISGARRDMLDALDDEDRDQRVAGFEFGYEGLVENESAAAKPDRGRHDDAAPPAVRELGRSDVHVASLPRFWDQTGILYRDGVPEHLPADPYLATGTMPPLSATFSDFSGSRETLPVFDGTLCTGCGHCWTQCPDSAIGVVAAGPAALIDAGIRRTGAEPVRQVASKLATRIISSNKKAAERPATFGPMLEAAFTWLLEKAPLPEERRQPIQAGVDRIVAEFGALPVAVTEPFFLDAEARQKDSAELLSIAVNPDACKACGICVRSCEPGALIAREQDAAVLGESRALWETWSATPDTPGTSLEQAAEHRDVGPTAAMLLSRYCQFAMSGGDLAEAGSGEKLAVRLLLGATEYQRQPIVQRFAETLAETGDEIRRLIHDTLSGTLPEADFDAIAEQLDATASPRIDLTTLAEGVTGSDRDHSIDTRYLKRLIDLSARIDDARQRLISGVHGMGRARYGLTVAGGRTAAWAGRFPRNPFQAPAVVDMSGDAAQLAAGLIEGHLDDTTELVRLLRLARLEIEKPDGLDWQREALAGLHWQDLEDDELQLCPPLILLGSDEMLAARGLSQLIWLLNSRLPVKVLVLSSLDLGLVEAPTNDPRAGIGLLALAQRNAYVAQTSIADAVHFGDSVREALGYDGPALVQVYAPSPSRDGFAADTTLEQAGLAVSARVLPLFRYDPRAEGVFGSRISLAGNAQCDDPLVLAADKSWTLADWAFGQRRFAAHFKPLEENAPSPLPLHEWLLEDIRGRKGRTPYAASGQGDAERRYSLSPALLQAAENCLHGWRTLQELAGIVTPFTTKLEAEIRAEVASEHQAELDQQKQAAATELEQVRQKTQTEIASKLRSRLLELATRRRK